MTDPLGLALLPPLQFYLYGMPETDSKWLGRPLVRGPSRPANRKFGLF